MRILPWLLQRLVKLGTVTLIGPDGETRTFGGDGLGRTTAEADWAAVIAECGSRHGRLDGLVVGANLVAYDASKGAVR